MHPCRVESNFWSAQILTAMLLSGVQIGFQIYFPMRLLSPTYGKNAFTAGLVITPAHSGWLTASFCVGAVIARSSPRRISLVTAVVLAIPYTAVAQRLAPATFTDTVSSAVTLGRTLGQSVVTGVYGVVFHVVLTAGAADVPGLDPGVLNKLVSAGSLTQVSLPPARLAVAEAILTDGFCAVFTVRRYSSRPSSSSTVSTAVACPSADGHVRPHPGSRAYVRPHSQARLAADESMRFDRGMTDLQPLPAESPAMPSRGRMSAMPAHASRRFFTKSRHSSGGAAARAGSLAPPSASALSTGVLTVFTSPSGGIGLSTLMAMAGLTLQRRGHSCALLDADARAGGLDVLLGLESEPGMRLSGVRAPLGRIDGNALDRELPRWEGVRVLGADPWNGDVAQRWDLEAALKALLEVNDVVLVDGGRGDVMAYMNGVSQARVLVLVELSVLGLARGRARLLSLPAGGGSPLVVGMHPRGTPRGIAPIVIEEAEEYLGVTLLGVLTPDSRLCGELLNGMGIESPPRRYREVLNAVVDEICGR